MSTETDIDTTSPASEHVSQQASQLCALIEDIAKTAPEAAKEKLDSLREGVTALCERGRVSAGNVTRKLTETVRAYPMQTAAAAVGAGLLTWWLLNRRR
jgi:ElaB/YqjD/DUF883 family membrane-anchored ribosome-binding protein